MATVNKRLLGDCLVITTAAVSFGLTICLSGLHCYNNGSHWVCALQFLKFRRDQHRPLSENLAVSVNQLPVKLRCRCVAVFAGTRDTRKHMEDAVTTRLVPWGSLSQDCPMSSCGQL